MTQTDYRYSLLSPAPEDHHQSSALPRVGPPPSAHYATLEARRGGAGWARGGPGQQCAPLACVRRVRVYSLLLGLLLTFLIMASYILTRDSHGFLITPPPHQVDTPGMSGAPLTFNLSSSPSALHDYASLRQVVRSIASRVEFVPRKVPDPKVLVQSEPRLFSAIPPEFLPDVKNPCWYVEAWPNASAGPYGSNLYLRNSRTLHKTFQSLSQAFQSHLLPHGTRRRLRCLPYFYIIGQPKCGTTDLYFALRRHPEVTATTFKEPHWWTRKRFGVIRPNDGFRQRFSVEDYLDLFDLAAFQIQDHLTGRSTGVPDQRSIITGEASASTMWDNNVWAYFYDNVTEAESPLLNLDFIHALQPEARFIVMLRDPVERLYSDYLFFGLANKSAEDFHEKVAESLQLMEGCLQSYSLRSCAYNSTINNGMPVRLHIGLYIVFILDWLSVFQQDQLLVLRLEDHASNRELTLRRISQFLSLGPLSKLQEAKITKSPVLNTRRLADRSLGPMLPVTRRVLTEFYLPFNDKLAKVLDSDAFLWLDRSAPSSP